MIIRRMKRPRIPLDPDAPGLNAAFAHLALPDLPPVSEPAIPQVPIETRESKRGRVLLRRETAHRGGKTVLVVHDFAPTISLAEIDALARDLRAACGCGGTRREREIELQGEPVAQARTFLLAHGFQVAGVR